MPHHENLGKDTRIGKRRALPCTRTGDLLDTADHECHMSRGCAELTKAREDEIIRACETLYRTKSFGEITVSDIGDAISVSRSSIYNYFQTKEEIFLALLAREYIDWAAALDDLRSRHKSMTVDAFADALAESLAARGQMLKLLSMNHYDMEKNSRPEQLTQFKVAYGSTLRAVDACLSQFFPEMSDDARTRFIYTFFPFLFGVYPYTTVTDKQLDAMRAAGMEYTMWSVYDIIYNCVRQLLCGQ